MCATCNDNKISKKINKCIDCGIKISVGSIRCNKCDGRKHRGENHYNWKGGPGYCIDCGKKISRGCSYCVVCYRKYENHWNYKGGPKFCLDCGKKLGSRKSTRCIQCSAIHKSGENHWNYQGGYKNCVDCGIKLKSRSGIRCKKCSAQHRVKQNLLNGIIVKNYCIDCGVVLGHKSAKRCKKCYTKYSYGENNSNYKYGGFYCIDCGKKITFGAKRCQTCHIKQLLKSSHVKNKQEIKLENVLKNILPKEYKYVGCGDILIEQFNPDFINCNGQKKIIELYGDYWHNKPELKLRDIRRLKVYKKYGYKTLIIWEKDLKNKNLENRILKFNKVETCH